MLEVEVVGVTVVEDAVGIVKQELREGCGNARKWIVCILERLSQVQLEIH